MCQVSTEYNICCARTLIKNWMDAILYIMLTNEFFLIKNDFFYDMVINFLTQKIKKREGILLVSMALVVSQYTEKNLTMKTLS